MRKLTFQSRLILDIDDNDNIDSIKQSINETTNKCIDQSKSGIYVDHNNLVHMRFQTDRTVQKIKTSNSKSVVNLLKSVDSTRFMQELVKYGESTYFNDDERSFLASIINNYRRYNDSVNENSLIDKTIVSDDLRSYNNALSEIKV